MQKRWGTVCGYWEPMLIERQGSAINWWARSCVFRELSVFLTIQALDPSSTTSAGSPSFFGIANFGNRFGVIGKIGL